MSAQMRAVATVVDRLGGEIIASDDMGAYAVELAASGWQVFPLRGKVPAIRGGRGLLDATSDREQIVAWWSGAYRGANIGLRVPPGLAVVDIDPYHGGDATLTNLVEKYGPLPATMMVYSGRGDGGRHYYYRRPLAPLSVKGLPGIDVKTNSGYVVAPPSRHPETGQPYRWDGAEPVQMPRWLQHVLSPTPVSPPTGNRPQGVYSGDSIADQFSAETSWCDLLPPHGWTLVGGDGDSDGSSWRHPTATSAVSATVRHGCLFVYSPNTPFDLTETENPRGVTRFRALAILDHGGDLSQTARDVRKRLR